MRVILAEDSALLREGLAHVLADEGHTVVAAVGDAEALLAAVEEAAGAVDVVVTDVRMPPEHRDEGLRAAMVLRARHPGLAVLVLSQYVETRLTADLLAGPPGRIGYLLKDRIAKIEEFLDALERVTAGGTVIDPEVVQRLFARTRGYPLSRLTPRETAVLELMAQGHTNERIGSELHLSTSATEKHINALFDKLGLNEHEGINRRVAAVIHFLTTT